MPKLRLKIKRLKIIIPWLCVSLFWLSSLFVYAYCLCLCLCLFVSAYLSRIHTSFEVSPTFFTLRYFSCVHNVMVGSYLSAKAYCLFTVTIYTHIPLCTLGKCTNYSCSINLFADFVLDKPVTSSSIECQNTLCWVKRYKCVILL